MDTADATLVFVVTFAVGAIALLGCGIWVYLDARAIGITKPAQSETTSFQLQTDMGPLGWALCVVGLWIVAFPLYLVKRQKVLDTNAHDQLTNALWTSPAGWYPDTSAPGWLQWWDGTRWTGHRIWDQSADPRPR